MIRARITRPLRSLVRRAGAPLLSLCVIALSIVGIQATSVAVASAGVTVTGTGSSYAAIAINNWVGQVSQIYGLSINYQTSSSVYGLDNFAQNQVNFGASEIGYSSGQASSSPPAGSYQYLPDIAGAECLMYNVPSQTQQPIENLQLTPAVMMGIFSGKITNWNNPAIAAINPGVLLPNHQIVAVYRTDPSGDNYLFSNYLYITQPPAWQAFTSALSFANGPTALWPVPQGSTTAGSYDFNGFVGQSGSDNSSNYVAANPFSITFVEAAYAIEHGDPCASVQNASGNYVQPSSTADAIALTNDQLYPDLEQNLTGVYNAPQAAAYPISAYSYLITGIGNSVSPALGAVLGKFIAFFACQGQISAGQLGYSPIPPNLVEDDFAAISRLPGAAPPPALNGTACPNPYLTGAATYVGGPTVLSSGGGGGVAATNGNPVSSQDAAAVASVKKVSASKLSAELEAKKHGGVEAAPGQEPGEALISSVDKLLGTSGPTLAILATTLAFLAIIIVPPVVGQLRRRRVTSDGEIIDDDQEEIEP